MSISALATSVPRRAPMPKVRCTSALLTTMSTLPPISPASSVTERPLVRSSGTSVTCGSAVMSSKPGSFFHGSAWPTQTMSAPAFTSACTIAWPDRGLAVGDQHLAELRVAGHFAQHPVVRHVCAPFVRKSDQHRLSGAVEPGADATRAGASPTSPCRCTISVGPASRCTRPEPPRQALAEEQVVAVMQRAWRRAARPRPSARATAGAATGSGGRLRAAGTARRRSPGRPAARSGLRRRRRSCPSATRPRAHGGRFICRVRRTGFLRLGLHQRHGHDGVSPGSRRRCTGSGRR